MKFAVAVIAFMLLCLSVQSYYHKKNAANAELLRQISADKERDGRLQRTYCAVRKDNPQLELLDNNCEEMLKVGQ